MRSRWRRARGGDHGEDGAQDRREAGKGRERRRSGGPQNASDLSPSASRRVACRALNRRCSRVSSRKTDCKCPRRLGAAETRGGFVIREKLLLPLTFGGGNAKLPASFPFGRAMP